MILKGKISSIDAGYRVTFPDREDVVSQVLQKAAHVGDLDVGDDVVVVFFTGQLSGGVIIAKV